MKGGDFFDDCILANARARSVHDWLEPLLRGSLAVEQAYTFKDRLKSPGDIRNKVQGRRNHEDRKLRQPKYAPSDVTDASGFRIVKLFNAEVPEALNQLLSLLETLRSGQSGGKLAEDGIQEIEFHTSRRLDDPLSIYQQVKKVVEEDHKLTLKTPTTLTTASASSYSSVHVIVKCEVGKSQDEIISARSEIQLRSVFEEAWSEISHRLRYAPAKVARASGRLPVVEDGATSALWLHLDALKSLTDGCAQYADLINRQLRDLGASRAEREAGPLDPAERSASLFAGYGPAVRQKVEQAYRARTKAAETKSPAERALAFQHAADAFRAALDVFPDDGPASLNDVLREELAFCFMFTGNEELRNQAEKIYRDLLQASPDRVSALLRLGQLRRDAGAYAEAKELMERGLAAADEKPDPEPEVSRQANWLLRRDLAYICWRMAELDPADEAANALLARAIELSEKAVDYAKSEVQHVNTRVNLVYYLVDFCKRHSGAQRTEYEAKGRKLLEYLRPKMSLEHWSLKELDSLERGEMTFGERDRAKAVAAVICDKIGERLSALRAERNCSHRAAFEALSPDEQEMYLYAKDVLED